MRTKKLKLLRGKFHKYGNGLAEWTELQGQRAPILLRGERGKMAGVAGMRPPRPRQPTMTKECLGLLLSDDAWCCVCVYMCVCVQERVVVVVLDSAMCRPGPLCVISSYSSSSTTLVPAAGYAMHACYTTGLRSVLPGIRPLVRSARLIVLNLFLLSECLQFVLIRVVPEGINSQKEGVSTFVSFSD